MQITMKFTEHIHAPQKMIPILFWALHDLSSSITFRTNYTF